MTSEDSLTAELEALELPGFDEILAAARVDCTGAADTCPDPECFACGVRDCPHGEPLHHHHDGCPACEP